MPLCAQKHKVVNTWYDPLKIQLKEQYFVLKNNTAILDSSYICYYTNGKPKSQGSYKQGKMDGIWNYYFENGNLRTKGNYYKGTSQGEWYYYFENGKLNMSGEIVGNDKEGKWQHYYENEALKSEGWYKKGKKEGIWKYYNEDGAFKAQCIYTADKGKYLEVYPSGSLKSEGDIEGGKSNGLWKYYYENKQLKAEGQERDGIKEGMWKYYHPSGTLMSEGVYTKGLTSGSWKYYYENGNLSSEGLQKEGKKDGYWKLYYKNGNYKGDGNFNAGEGDYKEYYESGKLKVEGFVANDKNDGQWRYFYESGVLEGNCLFDEGSGKYTGYYENGKLKMEGTIVDGNKSGIWTLYKEDGTLAGYYRTYYDNDVETFRIIPPVATDSVRKDTIAAYKPKARLPKRKSRYFTEKINEFHSIILAANPLAVILYRLPISVEYYFQERLGFEIGMQYYREPLFTPIKNIPLEDPYHRGLSLFLKQKFYQPDQEIGMFYFGHEIRFTGITHSVKYVDSTAMGSDMVKRPFINEYLVEYSILVGDRIMGDAKRKGLTADLFVGLGIGYRIHSNSWTGENLIYDQLFKGTALSPISIPIRFGVMIGYALGKSKKY